MEIIKLSITLLLVILSLNLSAQTFIYDFRSDEDGWSGDFADYPITDSVFYELEFLRTNLPIPLDTNQFGLKISGHNHSDDLFMFIKRKITGLLPNATYQLLMDVDFASNAPTNAIGIGGPPDEGVTMKAGATLIEPQKFETDAFYRMNIDKGNQSQPGMDLDTIGHVGVADTTIDFTIINRNNAAHLFTITADTVGEVWVCIGTDSGFEGPTTLYYDVIRLTFTEENATNTNDILNSGNVRIYPNPSNNFLIIESDNELLGRQYNIFDSLGRLRYSSRMGLENKIDISLLPIGVYYLKIQDQGSISHKFIKGIN